MKVILAGGGTAGHINTAIAISKTIKINYSDVKAVRYAVKF